MHTEKYEEMLIKQEYYALLNNQLLRTIFSEPYAILWLSFQICVMVPPDVYMYVCVCVCVCD